MRFEGTRPSGKDRDIPAYVFAMGKEELLLLKGLIISAKRYTPETLETQATRMRLKNFVKSIGEALRM